MKQIGIGITIFISLLGAGAHAELAGAMSMYSISESSVAVPFLTYWQLTGQWLDLFNIVAANATSEDKTAIVAAREEALNVAQNGTTNEVSPLLRNAISSIEGLMGDNKMAEYNNLTIAQKAQIVAIFADKLSLN